MTEEKKTTPKPELRAGAAVRGLIPQTIDEAARLAEGIFRSGMTPDSYKVEVRDQKGGEVVDQGGTIARLLIGILKGMEVGLPPITAISNIVVVNNRPSIWGDAALGLIQASNVYMHHAEEITGDEKTDGWTATCRFRRKSPVEGQEDIVIERSFSWAQAKAASLVGKRGPWGSYPARMLQMRARAWAMRDGFADVLSGLAIAEEVRDFDVKLPEPAKPEAQQDQWTMKALENNQQPSVDFSTMGSAQPTPEIVETRPPVSQNPPTPTADVSRETVPPKHKDGDTTPDGLVYDVMAGGFVEQQEALLPSAKPVPCGGCKGKGFVSFEETDPQTGEISQGIGPCQQCSG